jgi:hypothetical protein
MCTMKTIVSQCYVEFCFICELSEIELNPLTIQVNYNMLKIKVVYFTYEGIDWRQLAKKINC